MTHPPVSEGLTFVDVRFQDRVEVFAGGEAAQAEPEQDSAPGPGLRGRVVILELHDVAVQLILELLVLERRADDGADRLHGRQRRLAHLRGDAHELADQLVHLPRVPAPVHVLDTSTKTKNQHPSALDLGAM